MIMTPSPMPSVATTPENRPSNFSCRLINFVAISMIASGVFSGLIAASGSAVTPIPTNRTGAARAIPIASVDSSSGPEVRGVRPGQPPLVLHFVFSQWTSNCYVLISKSRKAIVIDPSDWLSPGQQDGWVLTGRDTATLIRALRKRRLDVRYVIATHGHLDHVSGFTALKKAYPHCVLCMHPGDVDRDGRPKDSHMFPGGLAKVDHLLKDGETISCDGITLTVLHTPGHSPGSICLRCGDWLFSGDTLFYHTVGRTNFRDGSGNWELEMKSIRDRLYVLPADTLILPGHDQFTTIGEEEANNPWITSAPALKP